MKKALVVVNDIANKVAGDVFEVNESEKIDSRSGYVYDNMVAVEVPEGMEQYPLSGYVQSEGEVTEEYWILDGVTLSEDPTVQAWIRGDQSEIVFEEPEDLNGWDEAQVTNPEAIHIPENAGVAGIAVDWERFYTDQIQLEYSSMLKDSLAMMKSTFGTDRTDSANASYETYKLMVEDASLFSSEGLVDDNGDALDTDQKVLDYANAKITTIKQYGVNRAKRLQEFRVKRSELEAKIAAL